ncbi:helix-turn-helix domain-containing protein [Paenibacillus polymyxa]|uniref:helix-turn-helix domain-containing protein n=1 Tax=Paenibacillus polymyxa TaxID=1406 RepID=UPI000C9F42EC|nr:helix-turn-helix transcriptional regulator [Paenibacillus polymyxa]KAE8561302.1 transcriptional regulator [Paenibacillus polymyxa]MCJ1220421.1 helix-turn-helix domain-containing protein [Paenibacillus polymyxa]PNQ84694.1 transcriptional regulator [Paenibacillus polymyxa]SPY21984.1 helix-turn-helix domain-containing protein [Paenibacillus polymyxa]
MEITPTIQAEVQTYLKRKSLTMTEFGHTIDLNVGTVSGIVTGNRSMSVHQLDSITAGMNLPPDYFYERYIEECIEECPLNWKKISPFLYRCIELGRLDCLQRVVILLLDNPNYLPSLFEVAENVYQDGYNEAAAYLYKKVAESEKQQHSERLAICQYRLFQIKVGQDRAVNLQAAIEFAPFVDRLDEIEQLDALKDLANVYRSLSMWDKVYEFAHQMGQLGQLQYHLVHNSKRKGTEPRKKLSRPLFVYIAYAELMCANACDAKGDHEQALAHIRGYSDLSWVKENDPDTLHWLRKFEHWAKINTCVNKLMSGDIRALPDYVSYISGEQHIFAELLNVLEVANRYNIDIDHILQHFEPQITAYRNQEYTSTLTEQQVIHEETVRFWYKLAKYNLYKGRYLYGFKCLIEALKKAGIINHALLISNCAGLFFRFSELATPEMQAQFHSAYEEVWKRNDQEDGFSFGNN